MVSQPKKLGFSKGIVRSLREKEGVVGVHAIRETRAGSEKKVLKKLLVKKYSTSFSFQDAFYSRCLGESIATLSKIMPPFSEDPARPRGRGGV